VRAIYRIIIVFSLCYAPVSTVFAELPEGLSANGARLIWVDFWASWCAPCRRSFPWMNEMQNRYSGDGFSVIAVNVDKERRLADEFLAEFPARFPIHYDPSGQLAETFDVQAMPSSFLMDAEGNIIARHYGFRLADTEEYEAKIQATLESVATQ
jgi:thiol-disulfide isomerase/thioredoxin